MSAGPECGLDVLVLNSGSSSLKFGLYRVGVVDIAALLEGEAERIGEPGGTFQARSGTDGVPVALQESHAQVMGSLDQAVDRIVALVAHLGFPAPAVVGHRIVHGGPRIRRHCVIDDAVMAELQGAAAFAPLHVPQVLVVV